MDRRILSVGLALVLGGLGADVANGDAECPAPAVAFEPQRRVGTGLGYEPGIEIDSRGFAKQADFFQSEFSPATGALHVTWTSTGNQLLHARQTIGPSIDGSTWCGSHVL